MADPLKNAPQPAAADDRKLVAVDAAAEDTLSLEDQAYLFWKENRTLIIACVLLVFAVVGGRYGWAAWTEARERATQQAYAAADTPVKLASFAKENAGHPLAGIALLSIADDHYKAGRFKEATAAYKEAAGPLQGLPFAGRAALGAALSDALSTNGLDGTALQNLAEDASQSGPVRAEAAYLRAVLAADAGDEAAVVKYTDLVSTLQPQGAWPMRAADLKQNWKAPAPKPAAALPAPGQP